jgi:uncharacterized membrane-anchored protein YjiN (DUF445 family)
MKRRATALLVLVILIYVVAVIFRSATTWLSYVAAAAEAGIVGALADWFAVVALFHHPLNIRAIPHTNIISRNKERIAEQLGEFIQREFLSPDLLVSRISEFNPARRLSEWLFREANVDRIAEYAASFIRYIVEALEDPRFAHFLHEAVSKTVRGIDLAGMAGALLDIVTEDHRHHVLLDAVLTGAQDVLARAETKQYIATELVRHFWLLKLSQRVSPSLSRQAAERIVTFAANVIEEVKADPEHELRQRFDDAAASFIGRVKSDPDLRERIETFKQKALESDAFRGYVDNLRQHARAWVSMDLQKREDSAIRRQAAAAVRFLGRQLHEDEAVQDWINEQILAEAPALVRRYRSKIGNFVEQQVNSWTNQKLVNEFERAIGPDLQYIRINGTVVGACAGLAIYTLTQAFSR